jgi:asparagine synthase (glutamine-hydrolysing)
MCGFAGFLNFGNGVGGMVCPAMTAVATSMALAIAHRGPDDAGAWADAQAGIALGHRRLAVVDLSAAGHQPMHSEGGRYVMAFNGEIYNHLELRGELEGSTWCGHSDTETLLAGFEAWGVEATLQKTVGMFAIALWDKQDKKLTLARDRFGEKPLYYGWVGQGANAAFVFGSELKALRAYPGFVNPVSREALAQYMRFMYVPAPLSIYEGIYKLEPGCLLTVDGLPHSSNASHEKAVIAGSDPQSMHPGQHGLQITSWWALADAVQAGAQNQFTDEVAAVDALEQCLADAVRLQSLADVPLGAFLSGGVDSSTIVALMQQQAKLGGSGRVKTFTVGFEEAGFDESPHAKAVAQHLGTDHSELFVTSAEAQAVIPQLPTMYDEPFADSSQIPTHLVSKAARQQVTVALSGDAGDELFGGYNRYFWGPRIWNRLAWLPYPVRQVLGKAITEVPVGSWDGFGSKLGVVRAGEKLNKLGRALRVVRNMDDLYMSLVSEWQDPAGVVKGVGVCRAGFNPPWPNEFGPTARPEPAAVPPKLSAAERMMYRDSMSYLPDDILCKVDRAAMSVSLETRVPFLDHRVAELAWRLPLHMKIRGNDGKWALRQVLYRHVPRELIERPKAGFGIPVGQWLRGPLRDWAESLLAEKRLASEGYFYPAPIRTKWAEHISAQRDHTASLWAVLMFQAWLAQINQRE